MIRFAPAGFDYTDWYGTVYPAPKPKGFDPLRDLAEFSAVEINSSFYRPPSPKTCAAWRDRVAGNPAFRFTAKLSQRFTHDRAASWKPDEVDEVRAGFDVLQEAGLLGAVLIQFPWAFRNDERNHEWLSDLLTVFDCYCLVVEVRHSSWNEPDIYEELAERGVGIANIDQPLFRNSLAPAARATSSVGYVRVHGRNYRDWFSSIPTPGQPQSRADVQESRDAKFDYLYAVEELQPWVERIRYLEMVDLVDDLYVVANNHYLGQAVANLLQLQSLVTGKVVVAPPAALNAYAGALQPYACLPVLPILSHEVPHGDIP